MSPFFFNVSVLLVFRDGTYVLLSAQSDTLQIIIDFTKYWDDEGAFHTRRPRNCINSEISEAKRELNIEIVFVAMIYHLIFSVDSVGGLITSPTCLDFANIIYSWLIINKWINRLHCIQ